MKYIILLSFLFFMSCADTEKQFEMIGGCEYIKSPAYIGTTYTTYCYEHKGDCSNPIHNKNIDVDTLLKEREPLFHNPYYLNDWEKLDKTEKLLKQ